MEVNPDTLAVHQQCSSTGAGVVGFAVKGPEGLLLELSNVASESGERVGICPTCVMALSTQLLVWAYDQ